MMNAAAKHLSSLFMLLFCNCVPCPTEHLQFSSSHLLKDEFSVKFSPFLTQITIYQTAQSYCTRTLSDLFQCYAVIFYLQIATSSSSSGSGSQNMKNQRTVVCSGVFFGGERTRIKEPSVSWGYFRSIKEPTVLMKEPAQNLWLEGQFLFFLN